MTVIEPRKLRPPRWAAAALWLVVIAGPATAMGVLMALPTMPNLTLWPLLFLPAAGCTALFSRLIIRESPNLAWVTQHALNVLAILIVLPLSAAIMADFNTSFPLKMLQLVGLIAAGCAPLGLIVAIDLWQTHLHDLDNHRRQHSCRVCGYDLRATPEPHGPLLRQCPECGQHS